MKEFRDVPSPRWFKPEEFDHPELLSTTLLAKLDQFRDALGAPVVITSDVRPGAKAPSGELSMHHFGWAVDCHSPGMSCVDLYLAAEKFRTAAGSGFGGIGLYPQWARPGCHLDVGESGRRWVFHNGTYRPLTAESIRRVMEIERGRGTTPT